MNFGGEFERRLRLQPYVAIQIAQPLHHGKTPGGADRALVVVQHRSDLCDLLIARRTWRGVPGNRHQAFDLALRSWRGVSLAIGKCDQPELVEQDRTVAHVPLHQPLESQGRIPGAIQLCGVSIPAGFDTRPDEAKLRTVPIELGSSARLGLNLYRLVHEPEDAGCRQQRQQDEEDDERGVAVTAVRLGKGHSRQFSLGMSRRSMTSTSTEPRPPCNLSPS